MNSRAGAIHEPAQAVYRPLVVAAYVGLFFGALPGLLWAVGGRLDVLLRLPLVDDTSWRTLGVILAASGTGWMGWAMESLSRQGRGLPISHLAPTLLVARGPYALMRHPIYVGYTTAFAGAGIATGSIGRGVGAAALLAAGSLIYALGFEEPRLVSRYGQPYRDYVAAVPLVPLARTLASALSRPWSVVRPHVEALANRVVLFRVGPTVWVTYGAFAGLGAALCFSACHVLLRGALALRLEALYLLGIAIWMLLGARLVALLYQLRLLLSDPLEAMRRVGFISWGGYLGLFTFPFLFALLLGHDPWWLLDRTILPALACSCVGRIGCLTYGCCYGRPAETGIRWRHPEAKVNRERGPGGSVARIPTQLLSSSYAAALIPVVAATLTRAAPGVATILGSLLYAVGRFGIECLRDEPRYGGWRLTRGQIASAIGAALSIVLLLSFPHTASPSAGVGLSLTPASRAEWLVVAVPALLVFLVCGVHWRRVGRWGPARF